MMCSILTHQNFISLLDCIDAVVRMLVELVRQIGHSIRTGYQRGACGWSCIDTVWNRKSLVTL